MHISAMQRLAFFEVGVLRVIQNASAESSVTHVLYMCAF